MQKRLARYRFVQLLIVKNSGKVTTLSIDQWQLILTNLKFIEWHECFFIDKNVGSVKCQTFGSSTQFPVIPTLCSNNKGI
jgi:hypothetical protein